MKKTHQCFYYTDSNDVYGPYEKSQLRSLYENEHINDSYIVLSENYDPIGNAGVFCRSITENTGRSVVPLKVCTLKELEKRKIIFQTALTSAHQSLYKHALIIVNTCGCTELDKFIFFSGTLISIGKRLFIATVGHTINKENSRLVVLDKTKRALTSYKETNYRIICNDKNYPKIDIGLIEVVDISGFLKDYPDHKPVELGRVRIAGIGKPDQYSLIVGAPTEHYSSICSSDHKEKNELNGLVGKLCAYGSIPLPQNEAKNYPAEYDPRIDIILSLYSEPVKDYNSQQEIKLENPEGMSGGGLWELDLKHNQIWTPENSRLIGIQCSWFPSKKLMRSIQIIHWLRLVYSSYSDLHDDLDSIEGFTPKTYPFHG